MKRLPARWPRTYEGSAHACYEHVLAQLISNTDALAHKDVIQWVNAWSDDIGAAIVLAFSIGVAWREQYPDEPTELPVDLPR